MYVFHFNFRRSTAAPLSFLFFYTSRGNHRNVHVRNLAMYVFVGIHFVMVAAWLWKVSKLFQFRVGFTSSLKFKNVQMYLWIMLVSSWVGDKVLLWIPSKRLRSPMKKFVWRALVVAYNTRWRSSRGGRRRSILTAGNCVSYSAPPPSSRPFPHTDRSRLGGGFGWLGARLDWLGVVLCLCMYVCMYLAAQANHKSVPGSIFVYAQAPSHGCHIPA